jgi:restriction system protein
MALWLVRAGRTGEHERKFLDESRIYVTWSGFDHDLNSVDSQEDLRDVLQVYYPDFGKGRLKNHASQIWPIGHRMEEGDWVVVPSKLKPAMHVAEITSGYVFNKTGPDPYFHYREVKWIAQDVPRSNFGQDLLFSMGAIMTICRIQRNNAEARVRAMAERGWKAEEALSFVSVDDETGEVEGPVDLEQLATDRIAQVILGRFKGHGLERLVEALLQAQGYTTHRSPKGPDKGVDILAASGALGFGSPRICVQVKSSDSPVDLPTLNQLVGSMQNVQADQGLLVSWGGFKGSVDKEIPAQFFRVRVWNQEDLIRELLANYERLPEDITSLLPLKRIWTVALEEGQE